MLPEERKPEWLTTAEVKAVDTGDDIQETAADVGEDVKRGAAAAGDKVGDGFKYAGESLKKAGERVKIASVNTVEYFKNVEFSGGGQVCGGENTSTLVPDTWGDADFRSACRRHDQCYERCGVTRKQCDDRFRRDLERACKQAYWEQDKVKKKDFCMLAAKEYHFLTSTFGISAYDTVQTRCTRVERRH